MKGLVCAIAIAMVVAGACSAWAGEQEAVSRIALEFGCENCRKTDATLSGSGVLEKGTEIFECQKFGNIPFAIVSVQKKRTVVLLINHDLNTFLEDRNLFAKVAQRIRDGKEGTEALRIADAVVRY